jgi:hypothetical protein
MSAPPSRYERATFAARTSAPLPGGSIVAFEVRPDAMEIGLGLPVSPEECGRHILIRFRPADPFAKVASGGRNAICAGLLSAFPAGIQLPAFGHIRRYVRRVNPRPSAAEFAELDSTLPVSGILGIENVVEGIDPPVGVNGVYRMKAYFVSSHEHS